MKSSRLLLGAAALVFAAALSIQPAPAFADSYQIYDLGPTSPYSEIYGLDTSGNVVLQLLGSSSCTSLTSNCYAINFQGTITSYSDVVPVLDYDNLGVCNNTPIDMGWPIYACNNGRAAIGGKTYGYGLWVGPDPVDGPAAFDELTRIFTSPVYKVRLNGSGDVAFSTGYENYLAYDQTGHTPEPGSLVLLATGALTVAVALRRKFAR